jgi:hypothetical protein
VGYYERARRCDAHLSDDLGRCGRAVEAKYAVLFDRDEPWVAEWLCGTHVNAYRRAGFVVRFLRRVRSWD